MIRPNARSRLTADDFQYVAEALSPDKKGSNLLIDLLSDEDSRDQTLDSDLLFAQIAAEREFTRISPYLYFYVLGRRALTQAGIGERQMADYLAALLVEFSTSRRLHHISGKSRKRYHYLADMLHDLMGAGSYEAFMLRSHIGNYALFMTGVFPDHIHHRATYGRPAPDLDYYEHMGSHSFKVAACHRLAQEYEVDWVYSVMAERFPSIRQALNIMSARYFVWGKSSPSLEKTLRRMFTDNSPDKPGFPD